MTPESQPSRHRFGWVGHYGWLLGLLLTGVAIYQSTPLMTGRLSQAHAEFEQQCNTCHLSGREVTDAACLKCHSQIHAADSPSTIHRKVHRSCATCHREHRSRQYPLRMSDPLSFDHDLTGFQLKKYHPAVACTSCHNRGKPYYSVQKRCVGCHRKWNGTTFDHGKAIGIPLRIHTNLTCTDCHPDRQYESPPICTPCHDQNRVYRPGGGL